MPIQEFINQFRPRMKVRLGRRWMYQLTQAGRKKVEEDSGGGSNWQVLAHLEDESPCTMRDIAQGVHLEEKKTKEVVRRLIDSGYVSRVERD